MNSDSQPLPRPCDDSCGSLPPCAPLAVPFVPFQQTGSERYSPAEALASGTLFPGLDLPFRLKSAPGNPVDSAAAELQALSFVITELGLYLDTHKDDAEAFRLFKQYAKLAREGKKRYESAYGPISLMSAAEGDQFTWLNSPWPWEYCKEGGAK